MSVCSQVAVAVADSEPSVPTDTSFSTPASIFHAHVAVCGWPFCAQSFLALLGSGPALAEASATKSAMHIEVCVVFMVWLCYWVICFIYTYDPL